MFKTLVNCVFALMAGTAFVHQAAADEPRGLQKTTGGLTVYLGVMPAQIIQGHERGHTENQMHGGVPKGKHRYHVMVAVFEDESGRRLTEAQVRARVAEGGQSEEDKRLEPMLIADAVTFGNYFAMAAPILTKLPFPSSGRAHGGRLR